MSATAVADVRAMLHVVPVAEAGKAELLRLMTGPDRHYHDIGHVATLWQRHQALSAGTEMAMAKLQPLIAAALAWHDAIYVPGRADNEARSAALWQHAAAGSALDAEAVAWVATTIAATADHLAQRGTPATQHEQALLWVLDLDLTPLGEHPEAFACNTARLAREFGAVDTVAWRCKRRRFLQRVAACPQIYRCSPIATVYEAQARQNIARELA